jgi:membrane-bound serine protease (ClpP class)
MITTVIGTGIAGLLLLFLEMFLPGLIAGVVGAILLLISVILAYADLGAEAGNLTLLIASLASGGLWWWWATRFQHTSFGKRMTLQTSMTVGAMAGDLDQYAGQDGSALTPLRPGGTVLVAGRRVDALTDGEFVEAGTPIHVIRAHGMGLLVRKAG